MSRKTYIVKIENPCNESWQEMSPVTGGKFCIHCSKAVIDFSALSDEEIIRIISKNKGNLCGRFQQNQLNREVILQSETRTHKGIYKYLAGILLLCISKNSFSNNNKILSKENIVANPVEQKNIQQEIVSDTTYKEIKGRIVGSLSRERLPNVRVSIYKTSAYTFTDTFGNFILTIPNNIIDKPLTLILFSAHDTTTEYYLTPNNDFLLPHKEYYLKENPTNPLKFKYTDIVVGGATIGIPIKKKHWWKFWK